MALLANRREALNRLKRGDGITELVDQASERLRILRLRGADAQLSHSHSMVPGGLLV